MEFITKNLTKLLLLLLAVFTIFSGLAVYQCQRSSHQNQSVKSWIRSEQNFDYKLWKDSQERWHSRVEAATLRDNATLKLLSEQDKNMKELKKEFSGLKSNLKNLAYTGTVANKSDYSIKAGIRDTSVVYLRDTVKGKAVHYKSPDGFISANFAVLNDTIIANIQSRDSLTTVVYWKRRWFLGRKHYTQEVINHNPNSKITFNKAVIVQRN